MKKKIYDLKNTRAGVLAEAKAAVEAADMELYNSKMAEVTKLNNEITALEALDAESGRFGNNDTHMINLNNIIEDTKADNKSLNLIDNARSGNEYTNAWAKAIFGGITLKDGAKDEELKPLYNALTVGGGNPAGTDGGFLVPIEFDNMIQRLMKDTIRLADFFKIETVNGFQGWRAVETTALRTALPVVDEMGTIGKNAQPSFKKVSYSLKKYGDRIALSNELLSDNTAGLMQYIAEWFAPKVTMTENTLLLALLASLVPVTLTATKEVSGIKSALNKSLNTAHARAAKIICNQDSYDFLDQLTDTTGKGLLVPNLADPDAYRFKGKPVTYADNDLIANRVVAEGVGAGTYLPIYMGNFAAFATLFKRGALEFATTNIGGDAWASDSNEVRGIIRMDAESVDTSAVVVREILTTA